MEVVAARLLARSILHEYDASTVDELATNPANQFGKLTDSGFGNMQAAQPCGNRRSALEGSETFTVDVIGMHSVHPHICT